MKHKKKKTYFKEREKLSLKKIKTCIPTYRDAGFSFYFGAWKTWKKRHAYAH